MTQDKLAAFSQVEGFVAAAAFTPTGELLTSIGAEKVDIKSVGVLANNVLLNAQKASLEMGTGRGQLVHIEAEKAEIIVRCLNEGTDPLKSLPGKAHIHLVLILNKDSAIGMAKMRINSVILDLADSFRA
jgi:predicted regulator of Ras-like GTPase activity (Roadblock/LC7/MglB family)